LKILLLVGIALILLSISVAGVSGFVYGMAKHTVTQTEKVIDYLTMQNSVLGNLEEGATKAYSKDTISSLGNALGVTTTIDNVYLSFKSDFDDLSAYYSTYNITVKFAAVGSGSTHSVGDTACTITFASPVIEVALDKTGVWSFDLEIATTAKSVSSDQATITTIVVTAESTLYNVFLYPILCVKNVG
jgi:hypothetical protein